MTDKKRPTLKMPGSEDGLPSDAELEALQAEINQVKADLAEGKTEDTEQTEQTPEQEIEQLKTALAAMKDQALRAMAESENVKRRAEREVKAASVFGIERFAKDLLSVSDNLGRALLNLDGKDKEDLSPNAKSLLEGIELTDKELMAVLARHGVKSVPGKGTKFDPKYHQAVAQLPSDEEKGFVAEVMQNGFTIGERTLRAAMVAVSTGPAKK